MRYYSLTLSDPKTGASIVPDGKEGFTRAVPGTPTFSSLYRDPFLGRLLPDPGALDINFDIPVSQLGKPQGSFRIKIWGIGLKMISQAENLHGLRFELKAGMTQPGLPLANSAQAGVIAEGVVYEGWGNWEGVDQTLDLLINPGPPGTSESIYDRPISFSWPAGTPLYEAIDAALSAALPEFKTQIVIDSRLVLPNDEHGYYAKPSQWASYILGLTQPLGRQLLGFNYPGVQIVATGDTIYVFDGTQQGPKNVPLEFQDLIGQPTWLSGLQIQFNTVLRADIGLINTVKFPTGIVAPYTVLSAAAGATISVPALPLPAKNKSIFQGDFLINEVHHFGQFRSPDASAWRTAFRAAPAPPQKPGAKP